MPVSLNRRGLHSQSSSADKGTYGILLQTPDEPQSVLIAKENFGEPLTISLGTNVCIFYNFVIIAATCIL